MSPFVLFHWIMIQIFIAHTTSEPVVRGVIGQPVQLPCFYRVAQHKDISDMCWGRGPCPNSKCNNKILHTTGNRVTFRKSERYSLRGPISYGDVSLTIGKVKAEDAGTYCCRIEIPGWFNDIKQNMRLQVVRAPPVMRTTTRKAPVSPKRFRKTTFAPQATTDHQTTAETAVLLTTTIPKAKPTTTDHPMTAETTILLTTTIPKATPTTTDHPMTAETTILLTTTVPKATPTTTDHPTTAETAVLLTATIPKATPTTTNHPMTTETAVLLTATIPKATPTTTDHPMTAETTILLTTTVPKATPTTTDHPTTAETAVLLTATIPKATPTTTDHPTTTETAVLLTATIPKAATATTDHQTTAETAVLLTTTVPKATTATINHQATAETAVPLRTSVPPVITSTTESSAVFTLETIAPPTFTVTANDTFPATMVTTSAFPDFQTGFQAADMRTEDDDMFCSAESVPLLEGAKVTTEFPSTLLTAVGTKSAHTSPTVEDMPTAATTPPAATMLQTPKSTLASSGISTSSDSKAEKPDDNGDKLPTYAILIVCVIVVSIFLILMLSSLFWKRKHTKKFIIKSLGTAEDLEKVFSGAEGENSIFSL